MTDPHRALSTLLAGPTGLGTSAARLGARLIEVPDPPDPEPGAGGSDPAYAYRTWGDGGASPLYCP
ncbi:MAG: family 2 encapsulin nanocompartment cargo protein terpene cyclase, partial [Actinomycetes bacterium]